jgi:hypothetical protein
MLNKKGSRPMSDSAYPPMRREVQDYLKFCERLLAVALEPNHNLPVTGIDGTHNETVT